MIRPLGLGGMAHVLLCRDERLDRLVAVKRLHAEGAEEVERRFLREAKLGAALNHPNLVAVFDTATDDQGVLIVMEYVEGEPLSRALRRGPLEPRRVARMARELGAALDHAHANGVVHRDVKAGNVLLRADGVTKLADLGIATAADLTRITRSGEVLGTAAYMAPEQLEGGESGPATDVYAFAVVCFEALTGERPRRGRTAMEIAHRIATEEPPDLRDRMPSAPAAAAEALKAGMARSPADRPPSAGAFAARLAGALDGLDAEASATVEPPMRTRRFQRPLPPAAAVDAAAARRPPATGGNGRGAPVRVARPRRRPARGAVLAVLSLVALAVAVGVVVLLSAGGGGDDATKATKSSGGRARAQPGARRHHARPERPAQQAPAQQAPPEQAPAAPATSVPAGATGAQLNDRGYALMQAGSYAAAVPVLQRAVASWPTDSRDITYAYALFNLGKSLNRSGRPAEAIPYLEKRLTWDDQRATVQAELDLARRNASGG